MNPLQEAFDHFSAGRVDAAIQSYRAILASDPNNGEANHVLGAILFQLGDNEGAREHLTRAAGAPDAPPEAHNNLGAVLNALGDNAAAIAAYERALAMRPDYPDALNNAGVAYRDEKRFDEAIAAFRRAIALNPNFVQAKANLRAAYRDVVPAWHFAMMDDRARNESYQAAIARAVPGKRVLDIGTGAGLLAMMSARAGAKSVVSCETVGLIAEQARNIVANNGLAGGVTVINKPSTDLVVGQDLPERAEVLVTETFASTLIGEGILPTIEHAHEHLLAPGATIIPAAASAMGYLAGGDTLRGMFFVDRVAGFDLAPFNDFAPPCMGMQLDNFPHDVLSDDGELMRFDFREARFPRASRPVTLRATRAGTVLGVVQWIRLELDAATRYENRPSPNAAFNGHWTHFFFRFPRPVAVNAGDSVNLTVRQDRRQITVELAE